MGNGVMGYFARGLPFFAWVVDETKEEAKGFVTQFLGLIRCSIPITGQCCQPKVPLEF